MGFEVNLKLRLLYTDIQFLTPWYNPDSAITGLAIITIFGGVKKIFSNFRGGREILKYYWGGGPVGSDVTLRENWSVFIRCRTMPLGAALAL